MRADPRAGAARTASTCRSPSRWWRVVHEGVPVREMTPRLLSRAAQGRRSPGELADRRTHVARQRRRLRGAAPGRGRATGPRRPRCRPTAAAGSPGTAGDSAACRRRRSSVDSTPPRLVACTQSRVAEHTRSAAVGARRAPRSPTIAPKPASAPRPARGRGRRQRGCRTRSTAGWSGSRRASSAALAPARSTRRCRVRSPRSASQASNGPAIAPCSVRWRVQPRARASSSRRDRGAEQDVGVPGEVLRHRVHDDVGAELERPLQQRRRERVVHRQQRAAARGPPRPARQVGDLEQRVRRRLEPEQVGAVQRGGDGVGVGDRRPAARSRPAGRQLGRRAAAVPCTACRGTTTTPPAGRAPAPPRPRPSRRRTRRARAALEVADRVLERASRSGCPSGRSRGRRARARRRRRRRSRSARPGWFTGESGPAWRGRRRRRGGGRERGSSRGLGRRGAWPAASALLAACRHVGDAAAGG